MSNLGSSVRPANCCPSLNLGFLSHEEKMRSWGDGLVGFEFPTDTLSLSSQQPCEQLGMAECAGDCSTMDPGSMTAS